MFLWLHDGCTSLVKHKMSLYPNGVLLCMHCPSNMLRVNNATILNAVADFVSSRNPQHTMCDLSHFRLSLRALNDMEGRNVSIRIFKNFHPALDAQISYVRNRWCCSLCCLAGQRLAWCLERQGAWYKGSQGWPRVAIERVVRCVADFRYGSPKDAFVENDGWAVCIHLCPLLAIFPVSMARILCGVGGPQWGPSTAYPENIFVQHAVWAWNSSNATFSISLSSYAVNHDDNFPVQTQRDSLALFSIQICRSELQGIDMFVWFPDPSESCAHA